MKHFLISIFNKPKTQKSNYNNYFLSFFLIKLRFILLQIHDGNDVTEIPLIHTECFQMPRGCLKVLTVLNSIYKQGGNGVHLTAKMATKQLYKIW